MKFDLRNTSCRISLPLESMVVSVRERTATGTVPAGAINSHHGNLRACTGGGGCRGTGHHETFSRGSRPLPAIFLRATTTFCLFFALGIVLLKEGINHAGSPDVNEPCLRWSLCTH